MIVDSIGVVATEEEETCSYFAATFDMGLAVRIDAVKKASFEAIVKFHIMIKAFQAAYLDHLVKGHCWHKDYKR